MTDTPNTPEPAKPQHDADTDAVVDAAGTEHAPAAQTAAPQHTESTAAPAETPAAAQEAAAQPAAPESAAQPAAQQPAAQQPAAVDQAAGQQPVAQQPADYHQTAQQPTAQQPTAQQPAAHHTQPTQPVNPQPYGQPYAQQQPNYGNGSFGQPSGYGQQPYAPNGHQQAYATAPGAPAGAAPSPKPAKRGNTGLIIATLAIGALVGGIAGAGAGVGLYAATDGGNATIKTVSGPQNITVNDPNNASTVTAVAAKASPSVVTISVSASSSGGTGSGIILTDDGYVLTNTHVVTLDGQASNVSITVTDNDGKIYTAKIVGTDPTTDLAVIKLDKASGLTPISWGDSGKLNVGSTTVAIGAPLGLSGTVTDGIVSALNRSISIASSAAPKGDSNSDGNGNGGGQNPFNFDFPGQGGQQQQQQQGSQGTISLPVIQTDASINPGNSGGALLNDKGELIGVNVAIASAGGSSTDGSQSGSIGVGFAIPSNLAKRISDEIIKNGSASHGLLGASVADASSDSNATTVGALIKSVTSGGAAANAGLKAGDVVVNFGDTPITDATDLTAQVRAQAAGAKVDVTYIRDGQTKTATVTLGSLPAE